MVILKVDAGHVTNSRKILSDKQNAESLSIIRVQTLNKIVHMNVIEVSLEHGVIVIEL